MNDTRKDYIESEHHAQDQVDKAVLTLSGGAFGVSFAFMNDVVGNDPHHLGWILAAWVAWGLSITLILITFYTSNEAFRRANSGFEWQSCHRVVLHPGTAANHYPRAQGAYISACVHPNSVWDGERTQR